MPDSPRSAVSTPLLLIVVAAILIVSATVMVLVSADQDAQSSAGVLPAPTITQMDRASGTPIVIDVVDPSRLQNPAVMVTPFITAVPTPVPTVNPIPAIPQTAEQAAARSLLEGEYGTYGFVLLAADGEVIASYNGFTPFVTASTYKIILMADIYRRVENGEFSLSDQIYLDPWIFDHLGGDNYLDYGYAGSTLPLETLLYNVGVYSSNASALTLMTLTTPDDLNATARSIGMMRTCLLCDPWSLEFWPPEPGIDSSAIDMELALNYISAEAAIGPVNLTTPYDMAVFQLGLVNDTVVSPWVSEQIVNVLQYQSIRDRLPVYNQGIYMVNKPGNLLGVVNDVGVLYLPNGPRAVAAMSINVPDDVHATAIIQLLGLIANGTTDL